MAPGSRSLPGVAFGNHVAADPRLRGARALSPFPAAISHGAETGLGAGTGSAGRLEWAGILPARPHDACRRESHREAAWRKISRRRLPELRALPGIGRYTAAAIASIVFDAPAAVVDGNVERVLGRVFGAGLTGEGFWQTAETLLSRKRPGDFNQAMMELGATVCLPRQPRCSACPVFGLCATRGHLELPKKLSSSEAARYLLRARSSQPLGFPGAAAETFVPDAGDVGIAGNTCREPAEPGQLHAAALHYCDRLHRPRDAWPGAGAEPGRWVPRKSIPRLPLTGLTRKILRQAHVI